MYVRTYSYTHKKFYLTFVSLYSSTVSILTFYCFTQPEISCVQKQIKESLVILDLSLHYPNLQKSSLNSYYAIKAYIAMCVGMIAIVFQRTVNAVTHSYFIQFIGMKLCDNFTYRYIVYIYNHVHQLLASHHNTYL